jgi:hypothetical protein
MTAAGEFTWSTYDTLLRLDFVSFAQRSFGELSPRGAFLMSWHIETVGAKLAALRRGELRRVIINKTYSTEIIQCIFHPAAL